MINGTGSELVEIVEDDSHPSGYFFEYLDFNISRLDENFHNPKYEEITRLLSRCRFKTSYLKVGTLEDSLLTEITSGQTPRGIQYLEDTNNGIPFLGAGSIDSRGKIDVENAPRIEESYHIGELKDSQIKKGDVLLTMAGTVGHCAVYEQDDQTNCNQAIAILRVNPKRLLPSFLSKYLNSTLGQLCFGKLQHIADQPNINLTEIQEIVIPVPDLIKQSEIVKEVQSKEYAVNLIEKQTEAMLAKVELVLTEELGFSLPSGNRFDFYSHYLLRDEARLDFTFNEPFFRTLDKERGKCRYGFRKLAPPFITFSEEATNPLLRPDESFYYVDIGNIDVKWGKMRAERMMGRDATSSRVRRVMHEGQILVSTTRPTRKAAALVPKELDGQVCSTGFAVIQCSKEIDRNYLLAILRTDHMKYKFEQYSSGSSYPEISKDADLPLLEVPYPPPDVQERIALQISKVLRDAKKLQGEADTKWRELQICLDGLLFLGNPQ